MFRSGTGLGVNKIRRWGSRLNKGTVVVCQIIFFILWEIHDRNLQYSFRRIIPRKRKEHGFELDRKIKICFKVAVVQFEVLLCAVVCGLFLEGKGHALKDRSARLYLLGSWIIKGASRSGLCPLFFMSTPHALLKCSHAQAGFE